MQKFKELIPQPVNMDTTARSLWVMRRALLLSSFPLGVLTLGIPIYGPSNLHINATQVGTLFSVYALMTLLMRPLVGPAIDRYGRRRFFLAGVTLQMLSNVFIATGSSYEWLLWGRVMQGVAAGMLWLSAYAITADLAAQGNHGNLFGSVEEMLARGGLYGAVIGAPILLLSRFDPTAWKIVFGLYAVMNAFGLWLAWQHLPETYHKAQRQTVSEKATITKPLLILAAIVLCTSVANAGLTPILIQFVQSNINSDALVLALAYLPSAIVFSFLQSRLGKVADRVGRKPPIAAGLITSGVSSMLAPNLVILLPIIGQWVLLPYIILWVSEAVAFSAATPAEQALVADLSGDRNRGKSFGLYTSALSVGQVVGPTLSGILYDSIAHSAPFYFNTVVVWLGAAIMLLFIQDPRRPVSLPVVPHEPPSQWPTAGG
jgi:DHA1 family multidrug resistance protein-like MFS transporter